jgi:hypothetical protein
MTATGQPTLEMLPNMQSVAATIAKDASENLAGVDVVSVSPLFWVAPNTAYGKGLYVELCRSTSRLIHLWRPSTGLL